MGAVIGSICKKNETCEKKDEICQGHIYDDHGFCMRKTFWFTCYLLSKTYSVFFNYPHMNKAKYDIPIWILMVFMNS